jgi:hypothetical protein
MSGGPVYNANGHVIGIVKGGLDGTDAVRFITPIEFAKPVLYPPFVEQCDCTVEWLLQKGSCKGTIP